MTPLYLYLLIINAIAFLLMLGDKKKAQNHSWRIPEWVLMTFAFLGGSFGALIAMNLFRHKTKHDLFTVGIPLLALVHVALLVLLTIK